MSSLTGSGAPASGSTWKSELSFAGDGTITVIKDTVEVFVRDATIGVDRLATVGVE